MKWNGNKLYDLRFTIYKYIWQSKPNITEELGMCSIPIPVMRTMCPII